MMMRSAHALIQRVRLERAHREAFFDLSVFVRLGIPRPKGRAKGHRPSRRVRASKTTPVRGKKSAGGRDDAAMSDQERFRSNRFLKAVFARAARGVVSMEEGFPGKKVRPFLVVMRNFRGGKGRNGEIFIQFSDAFFLLLFGGDFFQRKERCFLEREDLNASMKGLT